MTLDFADIRTPQERDLGQEGAGNWLASLTDIMKRGKTRINQFAVSYGKLQAIRP